MAAGIRAALQRLREIVAEAAPTVGPDWPFVCLDDGERQVEPLEAVQGEVAPRLFVLDVAIPPVDDGENGADGGRLRVGLELRVLYPDVLGTVGTSTMIAEDIALLTQALRVPTAWQMVTTGIVTVEPLEAAQVGEAENPGHTLIAIPFDMLYREAA